MTYGIRYEQGDILITPFLFTSLSGTKQRPVLVLSENGYNRKTKDIVVCGITSNLSGDDSYSVLIDNKDLCEGKIPVKSRIKADKIFTLKQSIIIKKLAKVKVHVMKNIKKEIKRLMLIN